MEQQIWDPLRRKMVSLTPEEQVRQWFIGVLRDVCKVPEHLMGSEVALRVGQKKQRADIVVFGRDASPVAVVECKRPDVDIDKDVMMQAARYNLCLGVRWVMLTNGKRTVVLKRGVEGGLKTVDTLPQYAEM
ncbi:MAG: type I restriction enzyme HsdR N-terminal domain-containing protein [Candidatus Cryptobacteroides sp.]|nr:type I restriction enzyme HsdR N-terminal domain-containing protein [Candidatus Cryptobacteroides sp.]